MPAEPRIMKPPTSAILHRWRRVLALGWVLLVVAAYTYERMTQSEVIRWLASEMFQR